MSNLTPGQMARAMLDETAGQDPVRSALSQVQPPQDEQSKLDEIAPALAKSTPRTRAVFYDGLEVPFRGMFSALAPNVLKPGQFSVVNDFRADDGTLRARPPTTDQSATGIPGTAGSARGIWSGSLNGIPYVVGAWYDGSKVGIYFSTNGVGFTVASQTSGAFGDTRFTDTNLPFSFQQMPNKADGQDYLVIQNGTDAPRVFNPTTFYGSYLRVIKQFSPPLWASSATPVGDVNTPFLENLASVTPTTGNTYGTIHGTAPLQAVSLTVGTSTALGDQVLLDFGVGGLGFSQGMRQFLFVSDQEIYNLWNGWKVEVSNDNITYVTLADPGASNYNAPVRVSFTDPQFTMTSPGGGLNGEEIVGFDLSVVTPASISALRYLRLTWEGTIPTTQVTSWIHGIYSSGAQLAFQQQYMLSYSGLGGLSESPGVVMPPFSNLTGSLITGITGRIFVPYVSGIYYDVELPTQVQNSTDLNHGCDTINVYRADNGSTDFFFFESVSFGSYTGGNWVYPSSGTTTPPTSTPDIPITYALAYGTALNISWYGPDAYAIVMPIALAMAFGNARSFVGGMNFYAASESNQAFRFRQYVDPTVSRSATYISVSGETINSFAVTSGGALSANTVWMFSGLKTRMLSGFDGYSLSQPTSDFDMGCSAPKSLTAYKDAMFWLDDVGQIRRFAYGRAALYGYSGSYGYDLAPAISKQVVSDRTTTIPSAYIPWACGITTFDRYYFFYTPSGATTNTRCLVYDETIGVFVEDTFTVGMQSACVANLSTGLAILMQGSDGKLYRHENPSSTTPHPVSLTTRELSSGMWEPMFFGRIGVVMDAQASQTMNLTKTLKPTGNTDSSTIDLHTLPPNASSAPQMWRWDSRSPNTQPGLNGVSSIIVMSWTMTPGNRVYSIVHEVQKGIAGADQT